MFKASIQDWVQRLLGRKLLGPSLPGRVHGRAIKGASGWKETVPSSEVSQVSASRLQDWQTPPPTVDSPTESDEGKLEGHWRAGYCMDPARKLLVLLCHKVRLGGQPVDQELGTGLKELKLVSFYPEVWRWRLARLNNPLPRNTPRRPCLWALPYPRRGLCPCPLGFPSCWPHG